MLGYMLNPIDGLNVLFNPNDIICTSNTKTIHRFIKYSPKIYKEIGRLLCINTFSNVSIYRRIEEIEQINSFLLELDIASMNTQIDFIRRYKIPYSMVTFSGNKSLHIVIRLIDNLTVEEYYQLINKIKLAFPFIDHCTLHPVVWSRTPNKFRENEQYQKLVFIGNRIQNEYFNNYLNARIKNISILSKKIYELISGTKTTKKLTLYNKRERIKLTKNIIEKLIEHGYNVKKFPIEYNILYENTALDKNVFIKLVKNIHRCKLLYKENT